MSVEELLKPRYKVIADYPHSPFHIDEIIIEWKNDGWVSFYDGSHSISKDIIEKCPAIFKKLNWKQNLRSLKLLNK